MQHACCQLVAHLVGPDTALVINSSIKALNAEVKSQKGSALRRNLVAVKEIRAVPLMGRVEKSRRFG